MHRSISPARRGWICLPLAIGFVLAAVSQARVALFSSSEILKSARDSKRYLIRQTDFAKRGTIYSSDGKVLAQSEDTYRLGLNFRKVPKSPGFHMALGAAAGLPASEISQMAARGKSCVWVQPMSSEQANAVQRIKTEWRADGISLERIMHRDYPLGLAASSIVGHVRDGKAASGFESSQNTVLQGHDGYLEGLVDKTGAFLPMRMSEASKTRFNGSNVVLTIDSTLQIAATTAIRRAVEVHRADRGMALIYEQTTGRMLAMASWPAYDPNEESWTADEASTFNPCTMGAYEPGSTFKILTLAKALDSGVVKPSDSVTCRGALSLNSAWQVHCDLHGGSRAHGQVNLEKAIAKSCNVSAATWALKVGYPKMVSYLEALGLLDKTTLGLPLERSGMFDRNDYAKRLQIANVGFGQALTATPVALVSAFGMLANGGLRMKPVLIQSVDGRSHTPEPAGQIVTPKTAESVMKLMEAVIQTDSGTGKSLRIKGYRLAGKTGTAQKINPKTGKFGGGGNVSSFVGCVPAFEPRAVVLVMVDRPKAGKIYGSQVAGPVFLELARTLIRYYRLPPNSDLVHKTPPQLPSSKVARTAR